MATEAWILEKATIGEGDQVANSLAQRILDLATSVAALDTSDIATILGYTQKIDSLATDGLAGVSNSLAYRVHEIERHLHSGARWFETAAVPDGEVHVADSIGSGSGAFRADAGNDTWGSWVQVLGSDDTPTVEGKAYFDPHQLIIEDTERASTYFLQFTRGTSGAAGLAAGTYTELVYGASVQKETGIITVQTGRAPSGSKLWWRVMCPGQNTGWMDAYIGIHEYEG